MNIIEYESIIINTDIDDWTKISCWGAGSGPSYLNSFSIWNTGAGDFSNIEVDSHAEIISLKDNLSISVAWGLNHNKDFVEEWANSFPDPHSSSCYIDFFYNGQLIFRDIYVSVDGGRCSIPLPKMVINDITHSIDRYVISSNRNLFFDLINRMETTTSDQYMDYIRRTGIVIENTNWMY